LSAARTGDGAPGNALLRAGDHNDAVRDVQERLTRCGHSVTLDGSFGPETLAAVRAFQTARGLRVDGICGPETWGALIESGYNLGDRLLYISAPMLRGDDVSELQRRLNALGFDAGREDGIFGPDTKNALTRFQRERGLEQPDGICGPATIGALVTIGTLADGSIAMARERDTLRHARRLRGRRLFLVIDPGLDALGAATRRRLLDEGAAIAMDTSGDDPGVLAAQANAFAADACIAIATGTEPGARCTYFANQTFRSEGGMYLALGMTEQLRTVLPQVDDPAGRTYRLLRETRMAAVVCELFSLDEADAAASVTSHGPELATALAVGIRRGVEHPLDGTP
jgi:N-acetylmuramoyl-L-alanine amidase